MERRLPTHCAIVALGCLSACQGSVDEEQEGELEFRSGDPSAIVDYQACTEDHFFNGEWSRVFWPAELGGWCWDQDDIPSNTPVVVLLPGANFHHDDYDFVATSLAEGGFAVVVEDIVPGTTTAPYYQSAALDQVAYLDSVRTNLWLSPFFDFQSLTIMGHSRGGQSVRYVANELIGDPDYQTRAVVTMAPTEHTGEWYYPGATPAVLELFAAGDEDVPQEQGYRANDTAGWNDWSSQGNAWGVQRSMKYYSTGAAHSCYANMTATCAKVREASHGYIQAFLRAHVMSDWTYYESYIRGDQVPGTSPPAVWTQYSDNALRRVIDNVEHFAVSPNTMGGVVITSRMTAGKIDCAAEPYTPHDTDALEVTPTSSNAYVRWDIPGGERNANPYLNLSFRMGAVDSNVVPTDIRVYIKNGSSYYWVPLADFVDENDFPDEGRMGTARINLWHFGPHNDVRSVYIYFKGSTHVGDTFLIDSLEFSEVSP